MILPTIEEQVINLDQARQLLGLGLNLESYFVYAKPKGKDDFNLISRKHYNLHRFAFELIISAYTIGELGVLLPTYIKDNGIVYSLLAAFFENHFYIAYTMPGSENTIFSFDMKTESEARGEALIHLLNEKIVKVEDLAA